MSKRSKLTECKREKKINNKYSYTPLDWLKSYDYMNPYPPLALDWQKSYGYMKELNMKILEQEKKNSKRAVNVGVCSEFSDNSRSINHPDAETWELYNLLSYDAKKMLSVRFRHLIEYGAFRDGAPLIKQYIPIKYLKKAIREAIALTFIYRGQETVDFYTNYIFGIKEKEYIDIAELFPYSMITGELGENHLGDLIRVAIPPVDFDVNLRNMMKIVLAFETPTKVFMMIDNYMLCGALKNTSKTGNPATDREYEWMDEEEPFQSVPIEMSDEEESMIKEKIYNDYKEMIDKRVNEIHLQKSSDQSELLDRLNDVAVGETMHDVYDIICGQVLDAKTDKERNAVSFVETLAVIKALACIEDKIDTLQSDMEELKKVNHIKIKVKNGYDPFIKFQTALREFSEECIEMVNGIDDDDLDGLAASHKVQVFVDQIVSSSQKMTTSMAQLIASYDKAVHIKTITEEENSVF